MRKMVKWTWDEVDDKVTWGWGENKIKMRLGLNENEGGMTWEWDDDLNSIQQPTPMLHVVISNYYNNIFKIININVEKQTCSWFSVSTSSVRLSQLPMLSGRYVILFWSAFSIESFCSFPADSKNTQ